MDQFAFYNTKKWKYNHNIIQLWFSLSKCSTVETFLIHRLFSPFVVAIFTDLLAIFSYEVAIFSSYPLAVFTRQTSQQGFELSRVRCQMSGDQLTNIALCLWFVRCIPCKYRKSGKVVLVLQCFVGSVMLVEEYQQVMSLLTLIY